jgi:hypothetical protein
MNWEEIILKEKYQGPPREYGGNYGEFEVGMMVKDMNHNIEKLTVLSERHIQELKGIDGMIPYHIKKLQELIDKMDEKIIEQAKYGGNISNYKPHQRRDFKAWKHGAKYRNDKGEEI